MKLISEQLPNDGGYSIKRLVDEANARLKQIGKQGKRAKIVAKKTSLTLQFTFKDGNGKPQKNVGLGGIPSSPEGILEAEKIAQLVTGQLVAGTFTWDWYNKLIGKDTSEQSKQLTCKEMVKQYKKHFFKQRKNNRNPAKSWYQNCRAIEDTIGELDKPLSLSLVRQIAESKDNNTESRKTTLHGLAAFLKYFDNSDYKEVVKEYKANNNPKRKNRNVPSDQRIIEVYQDGFAPSLYGTKKYLYRLPRWQFLYGLLATYGLRIHEAWNIANWDKPVTLKGGDWVTVEIDDKSEESRQHSGNDLIIPAILDLENKDHILCIKHATKTGYRMAMPLSPSGHNWVEEFNLLQPFDLPDIKNPLNLVGKDKTSFKAAISACNWFRERKYGFTPHDLRHAYNHRGHQLGYNPKALADSLGHTITMNQSGYLRHMSDSVKLQGMKQAIAKEQNRRSENELLKEENKALKAENTEFKKENTLLKKENELLRMKLKLNQAYKQNES